MVELAKGPAAWNDWRMQNPDVSPNLIRADLRDLVLNGCNFRNARLMSANLAEAHPTGLQPITRRQARRLARRERPPRGANLMQSYIRARSQLPPQVRFGADLSRIDFARADLRNAILREAYCHSADFTEADVRGADFSGAHLGGADFTRANLAGAQFSGAIFHETVFNNTNLKDAVGLLEAIHRGPSSLDQRTIQQSAVLPEAFLRSCGVGPEMTKLITSLQNDPVRYHSCFISYSAGDDVFARGLHQDLQLRGVNAWFAAKDLPTGAKFRAVIDVEIKSRDRLLLILSERSITSAWVEKEVETAFEEERLQQRTILFPIRLDDSVFGTNTAWAADIRRTRHIGDFTSWYDRPAYETALSRLLADLRARASDEGFR
jgi:uncharacterized protein YjbI with pentapeptide repeats